MTASITDTAEAYLKTNPTVTALRKVISPVGPQPQNGALSLAPPDIEPGAGPAAAFIAALSAILVDLARAHRFDSLVYLFDMAALEAQNLATGPQGAGAPPVEPH
jgi:hypothetical protein